MLTKTTALRDGMSISCVVRCAARGTTMLLRLPESWQSSQFARAATSGFASLAVSSNRTKRFGSPSRNMERREIAGIVRFCCYDDDDDDALLLLLFERGTRTNSCH